MPKATIKLQQTQPLAPAPAPQVRTADLSTVADEDTEDAEMRPVAIGVVLFAVITFVVNLWLYLSS